jgi:tetratricopeptide (TPR) repeat protein
MNAFLVRHRTLMICLLLAAGTLALYWPVTHYDFVDVDDPRFVIDNPHVTAGVTWQGLAWALRSEYVETWQPVTWVSHMLDCQFYGLHAGGHHLTNVLLHVASTLLLFLWLKNLTQAVGRSALVAALFAWHPLHVESVAWICERKDVLSTLFWMLALLAYTRYARRPASGSYLLTLGLYALGLMSKPMVVTLPFVLLLLDFWPFNRFGWLPVTGSPPAEGAWAAAFARLGRSFRLPTLAARAAGLVAEKIPFFVLALAMTAATIHAENSGGTLASLTGLPLHIRVANALLSYQTYLAETFWPAKLAFFYPYSFDLPLVSVAGAALLLMIWSGCCLLRARLQPYLLMGWCWWLGTLLPTIGLIQYCSQARDDRYMYIPSIGLFITLVWGMTALMQRWAAGRKILPLLGGVALAACLATSAIQIRYWQNSVTMARHAIAVTQNNYAAYESLGTALYQRGFNAEAIDCYRTALRISDQLPESHYNLGQVLMATGKLDEALEHFAAAVKLLPDHAELHYRLGDALMAAGDRRIPEAIHELVETVRLKPDFADAHARLGVAYIKQGQTTNALAHFAEAARLEPGNANYRFNLGLALLDNHQPAQAAAQFAAELKNDPDQTRAYYRLAQALAQQGDFAGAAANYRNALRQTPGSSEAQSALKQILDAHPELK